MGNQSKDLYREAVADAKKVREAAIANAKLAMEETIAPRIQEMLRKKLTEEEDAVMEADASGQGVDSETGNLPGNEIKEDQVSEETLDEILAELQNEETLEEASVEEAKAGEPVEEAVEEAVEEGLEFEKKGEESSEESGEEAGEGAEEAGETAAAEAGEQESPDDQEVVEMTVGELKDVIASTLMSLGIGGDQAAADATLEPDTAGTGDQPVAQEEFSLDEVLASLDEEDAPVAEKTIGEEKGKTKPAGTGMGGGQKPIKSPSAGGVKSPGTLQTKRFFEKKGNSGSTYTKNVSTTPGGLAEELKKSHKVINFLINEMNNVNLVNAKLIYTNKLFREKTLNESEKVKILTSIDGLKTIKDVKKMYEALSKTTFKKTVGKKPLKESLGFASKPVGKAPAAPIVQENDVVTRMQELAGIIKRK